MRFLNQILGRMRDPQRRFRPPPNAVAWEPRGVLGGAYRGREIEDRPLLVHAVWIFPDGSWSDKSVCRRIDDGHLVDPYGMRGDEAVTCPVCRDRVERSGLPRGSSIELSQRRDPRRRRRARRDPPSAGEYERHQRMPTIRRVLFLVVRDSPGQDLKLRHWFKRGGPEEGEVVAFFPDLQRSRSDNRRLLYTIRGAEYVPADVGYRLARSWPRATPSEKRDLYDHLVNDHGYPINPLLRSSA